MVAGTTTPAPKSSKAAKLFRKEEQGNLHAAKNGRDSQPFFSGMPGISASFIQPCEECSNEIIQPLCEACAEEKQADQEVVSELQKCEQCEPGKASGDPGLKIGAPDDPLETEADRMAEKVSMMPMQSFAGGGGIRPEGDDQIRNKPFASAIQRSPEGSKGTGAGFASKLKSADAGNQLSQPVQFQMENAFQADFSAVRIHTGRDAVALSSQIGAQAFAYQNHVYFNENKFNPGSGEGRFLLAHELTHTIQQGASPVVRREPEEEPENESWVDKLKSGFDAALRTMIPAHVYDLVQNIRKNGLLGYIKNMLLELFKGLFKIHGFSDADITMIIQLFITLKTQLPGIIDGLSKGDCKPLFAALNNLGEVIGKIAGNMWDRLMNAIEPVRQWLISIWETYLSPAIDKITAFAGELWEKVKRLGRWLWDIFYQYIVKPYKDAWDWLAKKLGFGDSDEPGVLDYVSEKLSQAWQVVKEEMRPVIEPVQQVIEGIKSLVSLEAVRKFQEDAKKWLDDVAKTATAMGSDDDAVANKQLTLREVLIPALNRSIDRLKQTIRGAGDWIIEKVNSMAAPVNSFVNSFRSNSLLSPVFSMISWVPAMVNDIRDWANDKVNFIFERIIAGAEYLKRFIDPVLQVLIKIVTVVGNLLKYLPDLIMGPLWLLLPKCIKDPIIKWLTEVVLKKIPIIAEFIELTEKWEEIKTAALTVIKQVFVDGQLAKGLWTYFKTLLGILGIDPVLVTTIVAKAAKNFSDIITKPGDFLKNVWNVIKGGFNRFMDNILVHLPTGALAWLFGEVKGAVNVTPPKKITVLSMLTYVMDLFGITKENVYKRMEENPRIGPEKVAIIRTIEKTLTGALEWISVWLKEGPEGLLKKAKEKLEDIQNIVINGIVGWVTAKVSAEIMKRLATSADPLGIGATINTIILVYDSIKQGIAYANRILNLINKAMDNLAEIIAGRIGPAAEKFEELLAKAVPVVIGFAVEVIIGPVGDKIKEIITDARKAVDNAIDSLINGALDMIKSLVESGKKAIKKILGWLGITKTFTAVNGESHELSFKGSEHHAELMIASTPVKYEVWIQGIDAEEKDKSKALDKVREINTVKAKTVTETYTNEEKEKELRGLIDELSALTGPLFARVLPKSKSPQFGNTTQVGWGASMIVDGLTKNDMEKGSKPSVNNKDYSTINQRRYGAGSYYILGHILNENLGGVGSHWKNITPLTREANSEHERIAEARVKNAVNAGNVVRYSVTAIYDRSTNTGSLESDVDNAKGLETDKEKVKEIIRSEAYIPTGLTCSATMKNPQKENEETTLIPDNTLIKNTLDQRPGAYTLSAKKREIIYLNTAKENELLSIENGINNTIAGKILMAYKHNGKFWTAESLVSFEIDDEPVFEEKEASVIKSVLANNSSWVKLYKTKNDEEG